MTLHISLVISQLTENAARCLCRSFAINIESVGPGVEVLLLHDQTEEGDYWECFWTETEQHAIIPSSLEKHFSSASLLLLYGQPAPLMMLWYVASPSITSLLGCAGSFVGNCLVVYKHPINTDSRAFVFELQIQLQSVLCWEKKQLHD